MARSRTKTQLSSDTIGRLVRHAFDTRPLGFEELTDGYFNSAFRVHLGSGLDEAVLKVAPPPEADLLGYEHDLMRAEIMAMRVCAGEPAIPAPTLLYSDTTRTKLPSDYLFMSVVPGQSWSALRDELSAEQNAAVERQLGEITATINRFEGDAFGYPVVGPRFDRWRDAFGWMCGQLFDDAARFGVDTGLERSVLLGLLEQHGWAFEEVARPRLVHWDLWAGNVFVVADGPAVSVGGVIDFERALWGDPLMEFIPGRLRDIEAYESGYGQPLLATKPARLRRIFYNVYLGLVLVVEDGPRQYADKSTVEWGRGLIERGLAMLHHGDVIDTLTAYA